MSVGDGPDIPEVAKSGGDRLKRCSKLNNLDTKDFSKEELLYLNRDKDSLNMIFMNEYALDTDQTIYTHFVKKLIYYEVIKQFWVPITLISVLLILIDVVFIVWYVNKKVLQPLTEMSRMTEFILNPGKK